MFPLVSFLLLILLSLIVGIIFGLFLKNSILRISNILLFTTVFIVIFLIGFSSGNYISTKDIFYVNFLLLISILSSLLVSFGSIIVTYFFEKKFFKNKKIFEKNKNKISLKIPFLLIIIIIFSLITGIYFNNLINEETLQYSIQFFLFILIFSVGLSIGGDSKLYENLKNMWKIYIYLPIGALLGSFIVASFMYFFISEKYILISSLGMGWYTYTSSFLLYTHGVEASFFGFLQNYLRELFTFFLIPFVARYFKSYSLITFGGATTMDNTLPVYILTLGKSTTVACLINGIIITIAVPPLLFLLSFL
jgi:uncharacterized membrane protein YbjE (DUF340 family)